MVSNTASYIKLLDGKCTFREVVNSRYELGKDIGLGMYLANSDTSKYHYGESMENFNDLYHMTLERCLKNYDRDTIVLLHKRNGTYKPLDFDDEKYLFENEEDVHKLFFHALRINIIRSFRYSYVKHRSGVDVEKLLIPMNMDFTSHMDGFQMLELIKNHFVFHRLFGGDENAGELARDIIWLILNGHSFKYVEDQLGIKGVAYKATVIQDFAKSYYIKDRIKENNVGLEDYEYDEETGLWLNKKR